MEEINKQAKKHNRIINCLLQIHIAEEETKFGLDENELEINLLDIDLYTKIDPDLIKKIYNDYIHLIALKKLNILHTYIYNNIHIVKSSTDKDIKKPYGFKF